MKQGLSCNEIAKLKSIVRIQFVIRRLQAAKIEIAEPHSGDRWCDQTRKLERNLFLLRVQEVSVDGPGTTQQKEANK